MGDVVAGAARGDRGSAAPPNQAIARVATRCSPWLRAFACYMIWIKRTSPSPIRYAVRDGCIGFLRRRPGRRQYCPGGAGRRAGAVRTAPRREVLDRPAARRARRAMMRRVPLRFAKYHGLGNDFVLVEGPLMDADRARRLCDRRRGHRRRRRGDHPAAAHRRGPRRRCTSTTRTARSRRCAATPSAASPGTSPTTRGLAARSSSTPAPGRSAARSTAARAARSRRSRSRWGRRGSRASRTSRSGAERLHAVRVSMGNPHAVLFDEPTRERAAAVGPAHRAGGRGRRERRLRAAGAARASTSSSGSAARGSPTPAAPGACAAAVAAVRRGDVAAGGPVEVRLPGGALEITVSRRPLARHDARPGRAGLRRRGGPLMATGRILVVDDERFFQELFRELLAGGGPPGPRRGLRRGGAEAPRRGALRRARHRRGDAGDRRRSRSCARRRSATRTSRRSRSPATTTCGSRCRR